jgi:hypothetical protein
MGDQWLNGQDFEPPPQWDEGFEFSGADEGSAENARFSEFFEALFRGEHAGGGRASPGCARHASGASRDNATAEDLEDAYSGVPYPAPGQDHHAKVVIDLEDTYRGAQRTISLDETFDLLPRTANYRRLTDLRESVGAVRGCRRKAKTCVTQGTSSELDYSQPLTAVVFAGTQPLTRLRSAAAGRWGPNETGTRWVPSAPGRRYRGARNCAIDSDARLGCRHGKTCIAQVVSATPARRKLTVSQRHDLVCFPTAKSAW